MSNTTTTLTTAADVIAALQSNDFSIADRVAIIRALRDTTPGLVTIDPHMERRVRAARAVRLEYIDSTINALENSDFWQQTAATTPTELRQHRAFADDHKPLIDELHAYHTLVLDSVRYHHFAGVEKSRVAYKAGKAIQGDAALTIKAHLDVMAATRPATARRRKKPTELKP
ncbi:MAG TPA: hypothetical protein VGF28_14240 [Thermoanaerobaculia bacterium]